MTINCTSTLIQKPSISIVMAVYNSASYLTEAVQSIINQSFGQFELITIDDGSTDGSAELLDQLAKKDNRIRVIHQNNQGVGAATNIGIKAATGHYIAIMDSDDLALPNRLEVQKNFLDAHWDIVGVGGQFLDIDTENRTLGLDFQSTQPEIISCCNHAFFSLHHPTTMMRRSAIETIGLYIEDRSCLAPDYDIFTRMQAAGFRFANVSQVVIKWRLNPNGLTQSSAIAQTQSSHAIRQWGFAQLLNTNPNQARQTARNLLMSFPVGTWFDEKLHRLLPGEDRAYLFDALKQSSDPALYFSALEYLILDWFEDKLTADVSPLVDALKANGFPWFAHQLERRYGLLSSDTDYPMDTTVLSGKGKGYQLSVLVPYVKIDNDLSERIANVRDCCQNAEIVMFSILPDADDFSTQVYEDVISISSSTFGNSPWEAALKVASGNYLAYLEPNIRFDPTSFFNAYSAICEGLPMAYVASDRYYLEALDESGMPYKDPAPHPKWTQDTLLGKERVILSGFCHRRDLLEDVRIPLLECGVSYSYALVHALAHRREFTVVEGKYREFVPAVNLENRILQRFKEHMLNWYFDSALGSLPCHTVYKAMTASKINALAQQMDALLDTGFFYLHWQNKQVILNFFATKVNVPLRFKLYRQLVERYEQQVTTALVLEGRIIECLFCKIYYSLYKYITRLQKFNLSRGINYLT